MLIKNVMTFSKVTSFVSLLSYPTRNSTCMFILHANKQADKQKKNQNPRGAHALINHFHVRGNRGPRKVLPTVNQTFRKALKVLCFDFLTAESGPGLKRPHLSVSHVLFFVTPSTHFVHAILISCKSPFHVFCILFLHTCYLSLFCLARFETSQHRR